MVRYHAALDIAGRRVVGPLRRTPIEAEADALEMRAQDARRQSLSATLQDAFDALVSDMADRGTREGTAAFYGEAWKRLTSDIGWTPNTPLAVITEAQIRRYAAKREAAGVTLRTIWQKDLATLRRMMRLARRRRMTECDPFAELARPRVRDRRFDALPRDVVYAIIDRIRADRGIRESIRTRDAQTAELLFLTGLRRAELGRLRVGDCDLGLGVMQVDGKTGPRTLPLGGRVLDLIGEMSGGKRSGDLLAVCAGTIHSRFQVWRQRLNLRVWSPHVLRHSFATAAVEAGVPMFVLAELLGHRSLEMVRRYFHGSTEAHRSALDAIAGQGVRHAGAESRRSDDTRRRWTSSRASTE